MQTSFIRGATQIQRLGGEKCKQLEWGKSSNRPLCPGGRGAPRRRPRRHVTPAPPRSPGATRPPGRAAAPRTAPPRPRPPSSLPRRQRRRQREAREEARAVAADWKRSKRIEEQSLFKNETIAFLLLVGVFGLVEDVGGAAQVLDLVVSISSRERAVEIFLGLGLDLDKHLPGKTHFPRRMKIRTALCSVQPCCSVNVCLHLPLTMPS